MFELPVVSTLFNQEQFQVFFVGKTQNGSMVSKLQNDSFQSSTVF
jgi:hypothetical protein